MAVGNVSVPFLNFQSFVTEEVEPQHLEARPSPAGRSPFVAVYELEDGESSYDPLREAYASVVDELHDEEFEEALEELVSDARALHESHVSSGNGVADADRMLTQHFARLTSEAEAAVDSLQREFGARDESSIALNEVEAFIDNYASSGETTPVFENFLGKFVKKLGKAVKSVASKAVQGIKKIGLGFIFNKLRALVQPFLQRVLMKVIGKLPEAVRPAARLLAGKLGFALPAEPTAAPMAAPADSNAANTAAPANAAPPADAAPADTAGNPVQPTTGADAGALSQELDEQIAETLLGQDEAEVSLEVARVRSATQSTPVFQNLDAARERFVDELSELREGESAEPVIQNFLPAALPALRVGIKLLGRPRVVGFLAQFLSKLVAKLIGPQQAPALSKALVDAGLRLLTLEVNESDEARLGPSAVAATVEETVARVASLPEHVLEDRELLEAFTLEAFEQAAAANLPAVLSEAVYQKRPELLEGGVDAGWVYFPLRGRKRYKRCSRTFTVKITPHLADEVESFEGAALSEYLQDQLGVPEGAELEAELHLFETLPGSNAADIAHGESEAIGLGSADEATVAQLHPLTEAAAASLIGKSALGRNLLPNATRHNLPAGQRLFHLAIPGARPLPATGRRRHARRLAHVNVVLDAVKGQIRVSLYLSEVRAQRLALKLRQQGHAGALAVTFNRFLARRLNGILAGKHKRRLRVVQAGKPASALSQLAPNVAQAFNAKLREWLLRAYTDFVKTRAAEFQKASEDPADGVTLRFVIEKPPGLNELSQALAGSAVDPAKLSGSLASGNAPTVHVEVLPGHKCV